MNSITKTKRVDTTRKYLDALQDKYSKLNVIRIDLAYKKPYSDKMNTDEVNKDIKRMFTNMRNKPSVFKDKVGYILKKEFTEDKGIHMHAFFIYNGNKVLKDIHKADEIGSYWKEQITKGKGIYYNCNKNNYQDSGVGMIEYRDKNKRKNLDMAVEYLCKDEQVINTDSNRAKSFTRGLLPKTKSKVGRQRVSK